MNFINGLRMRLIGRRCMSFTSTLTCSSSTSATSTSIRGHGGIHHPVLLKEVLEMLRNISNVDDDTTKSITILDATFGGGGYTRGILSSFSNPINVIAMDRDPSAYRRAERLRDDMKEDENTHSVVIPLHGRFGDLRSTLINAKLMNSHGVFQTNTSTSGELDAVVFDIGVSSMQIDNAERGFSVIADGPLDMRMSVSGEGDALDDIHGLSAFDVINGSDERTLSMIFKKGGYSSSRAVTMARCIMKYRHNSGVIKSTNELEHVLKSVIGRKHSQQGVPVCTKAFMCLRMYVNAETDELINGVQYALKLLRVGGVLVVVSFNSLEDMIVKRLLTTAKEWVRPLHKKVIRPSKEEVESNPRARSALLRAIIKTDTHQHTYI